MTARFNDNSWAALQYLCDKKCLITVRKCDVIGVTWCFDCVEISSKLDSAESRCNVLEKQLEYMRRMVHSAESDRSQALRHTAQLQRQQVETEALEVQAQLDKIKDLEREHLKLSASQTLAEVAASSSIYILLSRLVF